jgi:Tfp pilus assembly protein PilF
MKAVNIFMSSDVCLVAVAFVLTCSGCASPTSKESGNWPKQAIRSNHQSQPGRAKEARDPLKERIANNGEHEFQKGIKSYEEGAYKSAAKQFQVALDLGLDARGDQAKAHKYLAFITCASGREKACREEFRKALDADPTFELEPAESGHPIWAPIFRRVKADAASKENSK